MNSQSLTVKSGNDQESLKKQITDLIDTYGAENLASKFERIFDLACFHCTGVQHTDDDISGLFFLKQLYTILQGKVN